MAWGDDSDLPEICPYCGEKWKHCEDYDQHLDRWVEDQEDT